MPAAPNEARARDVAVRTSRFAIHSNAYVDFYVSALSSSLSADGADRGALPLLDANLVAKLGACSHDLCAKSALVETPLDRLDGFLAEAWGAHESEARRLLGREGTPLMNLEDALAPALARQIGIEWPSDPFVVYLAHAQGRFDESGGRQGAVLDVQGECFEGGALLECLFTRALEVLLPASALGRAIAEEGARFDDGGRAAPKDLLPCLASLATDAAVAAGERHYRPTRRFVTVCSPQERMWLADEWSKRLREQESPREFAAKLLAEAVRAGW